MNVALVTVDCLRADHLGCYGYGRETPNIDALAGKGLRFTHAYANAPYTPGSFLSLFTSHHPLDFKQMLPLPPASNPLPEVLGIESAAVHSNPLLSRHYGYQRGWNRFEDHLNSGGGVSPAKYLPRKLRLLADLYFGGGPYAGAETITGKALRHIHDMGEPWFMWAHYMDLHHPLRLPPERKHTENMSLSTRMRLLENPTKDSDPSLKQGVVDAYDDNLRHIDSQVGRLVEAAEDTVFIVTADHGEEFLEHGGYGHRPKLYNELLHVPLILSGPGVESGVREGLVSHVDVAPTILSLYGLKPPEDYVGENLFTGGKKYVFSEALHNERGQFIEDDRVLTAGYVSYAVQSRELKLIKTFKGGELVGRELYNLLEDPGETVNLTEDSPLEKELDRHIQSRMLREAADRVSEDERL